MSQIKPLLVVWILLIFSSFCYALGPNGYKMFVESGLAPEVAVGFFLCIGAVIMLPVWLKTPRDSLLSVTGFRPWMWFILIVEGILMPTYFLLFIYAMEQGTIVQVSLLSRLSPVLVVFLAILILKEGSRIASKKLLFTSLLLCLLGVFAASQDSISALKIQLNWLVVLGLLVALSDALRQTLMPLVQKSEVVSDSGLVVITMLIGGVAALVFAYVVDPNSRYPVPIEYLGLVLLGFVTVAVPKWLRLMAYSMSKTQIMVSASSYMIVIFAGLIAWVWHGETIEPISLGVAFSCVVLGLFLLNRSMLSKQ